MAAYCVYSYYTDRLTYRFHGFLHHIWDGLAPKILYCSCIPSCIAPLFSRYFLHTQSSEVVQARRQIGINRLSASVAVMHLTDYSGLYDKAALDTGLPHYRFARPGCGPADEFCEEHNRGVLLPCVPIALTRVRAVILPGYSLADPARRMILEVNGAA